MMAGSTSTSPWGQPDRSETGRQPRLLQGPQQFSFDILRIELPSDQAEHSRKVWNHVDEMRIDADASVRLARNGIRIGVAGQASWPAIEAIARSVGGTISSTSLASGGAIPVSLALADVQGSETVFVHDTRSGLKGRTFHRGQKVLTFTGWSEAEIAAGIRVGVEFEIRHESGDLTWQRAQDGIQAVPMVDRQVFEELTNSTLLGPGDILLIGPNHDVEHAFLLGGKYFEITREGRRKDVVICLTAGRINTDRSES
ncbi:MAG: hypothetical protein ACPGXK_10860 [Phycisphaerae bacterium]